MLKNCVLTGLLVAAIASPAMALTPQESEKAGFNYAMRICNAIWKGAKTPMDIIMLSPFNNSVDNYITQLTDAKGKNHPLVKAYDRGFDKGLEPCEKQFREIAKQGPASF